MNQNRSTELTMACEIVRKLFSDLVKNIHHLGVLKYMIFLNELIHKSKWPLAVDGQSASAGKRTTGRFGSLFHLLDLLI